MFSIYKEIMLHIQIFKVVWTGEGYYKKQWVTRFIVNFLFVNHIVFLLWHEANISKGLLFRFLPGGKWQRDTEWVDREREVTATMMVNIFFFFLLGAGIMGFEYLSALFENPIRWSLSILLQWKHQAPPKSTPQAHLHTKEWRPWALSRNDCLDFYQDFCSLFLPPLGERTSQVSNTLRVLYLQGGLKVFFFIPRITV